MNSMTRCEIFNMYW